MQSVNYSNCYLLRKALITVIVLFDISSLKAKKKKKKKKKKKTPMVHAFHL